MPVQGTVTADPEYKITLFQLVRAELEPPQDGYRQVPWSGSSHCSRRLGSPNQLLFEAAEQLKTPPLRSLDTKEAWQLVTVAVRLLTTLLHLLGLLPVKPQNLTGTWIGTGTVPTNLLRNFPVSDFEPNVRKMKVPVPNREL